MNRRDFLKGFMAGGVVTTAGIVGMAEFYRRGGLDMLARRERTGEQLVMTRLTYGVTPTLTNHVERIGAQAFIREQLYPESIDDPFEETINERFPYTRMTVAEIRQDEAVRPSDVLGQTIHSTIERSLYSRRQLNEIMVRFWADHFNVYRHIGFVRWHLVEHDNQVLRPHAMGNFRTLLKAVAHSPSMLNYLDNDQSSRPDPNENFARELLELHTLGHKGGYTETDVEAVAHIFTGWRVQYNRDNPNYGQFWFDRRRHTHGEKQFMGHTIPQAGEAEGDQLLDLLAAHPATAGTISTKLVRRFVSDPPPARLVERVANTYNETDGDIRAMLKTIFQSRDFWQDSPRLRSGYELLIASLRAVDYQAEDFNSLDRSVQHYLHRLQNVPYDWPAPDGYPDHDAHWRDALLDRWNAVLWASQEHSFGAPRLSAYDDQAMLTHDSLNQLGRYLLGRSLTKDETRAIFEYAVQVPGSQSGKLSVVLPLLLASPAFQYR